jgi:hypothetical protein
MTSSLFLQGIKHPGILHDVWARDTQEGKERPIGFVFSHSPNQKQYTGCEKCKWVGIEKFPPGGKKPSLMSPQFLNFEEKGELEGVLSPPIFTPEREFSLENHENLALLLLSISLLLRIIAPLSALEDHAIAGL